MIRIRQLWPVCQRELRGSEPIDPSPADSPARAQSNSALFGWSVRSLKHAILALLALAGIAAMPKDATAAYPAPYVPNTTFYISSWVAGIGYVSTTQQVSAFSPYGTFPPELIDAAKDWTTTYLKKYFAEYNSNPGNSETLTYLGPTRCTLNYPYERSVNCWAPTIRTDRATGQTYTIDRELGPFGTGAKNSCPNGDTFNGPVVISCTPPPVEPLACQKNNGSLRGNPCDAGTGNKYQREADHTAAGDLAFARHYNSQLKKDIGLGVNWTAAFARRLEIYGTAVQVRDADGHGDPFSCSSTPCAGQANVDFALVKDATGYTLTRRDGAVERYDTGGFLVRETTRTGLTTTYPRDSKGRLGLITGPHGHTLNVTYDGQHIAAVTDALGRSLAYTYDANSNLVRVTYPDGTARQYHYESTAFPNHLTGISEVKADGMATRRSTYAYNASGKAESTEAAGSQEKFTFTYDSASQTTVTDAVGTKEVMTFATNLGAKNLVSLKNLTDNKILTQVFDAKNSRTCRQDEEGRVTTYTYNATNQKLSETAGRTGTCTTPVNTAATRTTTYEYLSPTLDLPTVIESPSVGGASLKKRTEITYDATLRVPRTITQKGYTPSGAAVSRSITLDYNTYGQVTSIDGPRTDVNDVTTLAYNECSTGGGCGQLQSLTNALAQVTTFDAYDANGRLIEQTNPNGLKTFYGYDLRGRVLSVTLQAPDGSTRLTGYSYDAAGNVTEVRTPDGRVLTYTYDAAQDLRTVTDNLGNKVEYGYDLKGNRTSTKTYDPQGTLVRSIALAFDARNRVKEINDGGSITQQVWDAIGNLTKVTDPNTVAVNGTAATVNEYDALNRLFKTTDRLSGISQYSYDSSDRVKQVTAPNSAATGYAVDDLGNILKETSPDRGVLTYTYDEAGNVTSLLDARGITVAYSHDALNRLTTADYPGTAEDVSYTYDTAPGCAYGKGRLCTVTDGSGASAYAFDAFGNLATHTRTEIGVSATTGYSYDPLSRVASITYPDGRVVAYTRNSLGQVTGVTLTQGGATQSLASQIGYRADGLLTSLTYGNGVAESRLYTLAGRLETWTVGSETRGLIYDANGNLKERTGTATATFSYDALDRLKDESLSSLAQSFTYDPNGNRRSDGSGQYDYLAQSNRLTTTPGGAITLDPAGNLTHQGARTFGYYANGQLQDITEAGTPLAAYAYNGERQRTRKTVGTDTTVYHYDLAGNLLMETDAAGIPRRAYVWLNGRPLAQLDPNGIVYLHTDQLDTPRLATNSAGTKVWTWEGEAFGDTAASEDPDGDGTLTTVNLRFPGQYYDAETGLHYNWNRYYDPKLGRYITSDPIGIEGGLNTYSYVYNNPLRGIDPTGLMGYGTGKGPFPKPMPSRTSVFGCMIGCVSSPIDGKGGASQASLEATLGGGIEICEDQAPKQCKAPQPKKPKYSCGIYDPNCDDKVQPPDLPIPTRRVGLGYLVGASVKQDGRICIRMGLFGSLPFVPSIEKGDLDEQ